MVQLVFAANQVTEIHQQVHVNSHCYGTATQSINRRKKTSDGTSTQPDKQKKRA